MSSNVSKWHGRFVWSAAKLLRVDFNRAKYWKAVQKFAAPQRLGFGIVLRELQELLHPAEAHWTLVVPRGQREIG